MLKISSVCGYNLAYDESRRLFVITDTDGTELVQGDTQTEAESKAKALSKQEFKRIPIVHVHNSGQVRMGEVTSLNRDDKSVWVSMAKREDESYGGGRGKVSLDYDRGYYEATAKNLNIAAEIEMKEKTIKVLLDGIDRLIKTLENPIGRGYFGITDK